MTVFRLSSLFILLFYYSLSFGQPDSIIISRPIEVDTPSPVENDNPADEDEISPTVEQLHEVRGIGIYHDNDNGFLLWGKDEDRNYTAGLGLSISGKYFENLHFIDELRRGADWLFRVNDLHQTILNKTTTEDINQHYGFKFGFSGFTPDTLDVDHVIPNDRPYGSILYFSSERTSARIHRVRAENAIYNKRKFKDLDWSITSEFVFAMLGTSVAGDFQTNAHTPGSFVSDLVGNTQPIPLGWHLQVSNGGEPTILYRVNYTLLLRSQFWKKDSLYKPKKAYDFAVWTEAMAGYYSNLGIGIHAKLGFFNTPFWRKMTTAGSSFTLNDTKSQKGFKRWIANNVECFAFLNIGGRLIGYNALLQGQFNRADDPHTFNSSAINRLIYETEFGFALRIAGFLVTWHPIVERSSEFFSPISRKHRWGAISFSWNWESGKPE